MVLTDAYKTLLGIIIIKLALGFTNDWGVISIYIVSYFYYHGAPIQINASTSSLMVLIMIVPVVICLIISIKVANYVGFPKLIKCCAVVFLVSSLVCFISFNFVCFLIFNFMIALSAFALALPPIFHCLYSHFIQNKSLATGVVIGCFSLGAILWNLVFTISINPDNTVPDVKTTDPNVNFFSQQIANSTPKTTNLVYLIAGILFTIGSQLITVDEKYQQSENSIDLNASHHISEPVSPHVLKERQATSNEKEQKFQLKKYFSNPICILLFFLNISCTLFQVYVQLNTKLVYMPFLQDDHLISVGLMVTIISSVVFSVFWGLLADKKGPPFAIICFSIFDLGFKIYSCITRSKTGFLVSMVLIGATDKTMLILFGPILIDCFGLGVASQLLPYKGVSGIASVIVAEVLGFFFSKYSSPQKGLYYIGALSILNIGFCSYLAYMVHQQEEKSKIEGGDKGKVAEL